MKHDEKKIESLLFYIDSDEAFNLENVMDCMKKYAEHMVQQKINNLKLNVSIMKEPLPSAYDHKEYNKGVRDGVILIRNAVIKLINNKND